MAEVPLPAEYWGSLNVEAGTKRCSSSSVFTTTDPGQGTGLGLATVFGIVRRCGGANDVDSEGDHGTMTKVLIPAVELDAVSLNPPLEPVRMGIETVLLVEDEEGVRKLARLALETYGYHVLEANNGREALELFDRHRDSIQLVISDVVMPEMNGRVMVEKIRETAPDVKVLFMSGYTDDTVVRHSILEARVDFLPKPFTAVSLAKKVREALDR
jgi:two-component system, cell cycle sensor histidine kinase and response regulator CckA